MTSEALEMVTADPCDLAFGVFSDGSGQKRVGASVGASILDLASLLDDAVFAAPSLNAFLACGRVKWTETRDRLADIVSDEGQLAKASRYLLPVAEVTMHLPIEVGDYVDFYSSRRHAENLGQIFRPGTEPLNPNWRYLPVGYHGRAGTIVVSGTPVCRPCGQLGRGSAPPEYGPTERLDIEAEIGFVIGTQGPLGEPVPTSAFTDHVFGVVVVNDWTARDIQAFETAPLGPFLGKSFATSISPWVVPLQAIEAARVTPPRQEPPVAPYLRDVEPWGFDLELTIMLNGQLVSSPRFADMYWTPAQQLAHLTVNGASTRPGDLFASGTVSSEQPDAFGSLIEITWNGEQRITLSDGSTRTFLEDGDVVEIGATAPRYGGGRFSLGSVVGSVLPARSSYR